MNSEIINLRIPFDFLLQAIASLSAAEKERLWEFLDTDLQGVDPEEILDLEVETEVAQAYEEYQAGDYIKLDEYVAQRAQHAT